MHNRINILLAAVMMFPLWVDAYQPPVGWHWYNQPLTKKQRVPDKMPNSVLLRKLPPLQQVRVLHWYALNALAEAVLHPSVDHNRAYLHWQQFFTAQAGKFSQMMEATLLEHPALDYNLKYSHYNNAAPVMLGALQKAENKVILQDASTSGLFFFYRGHQPLDVAMAPVIKQFAQSYHFTLITIAVDGKTISLFPHSYPDEGQSKTMGVKAFPALFLVNPKTHHYQPVAYGFISRDDLARQFLAIATRFKEEF